MLMNKILFALSAHMKCKIIKGDDKQPYLERYMVARWGKNGEHTIFLHRFLDSDSDRGIHDHPWDSKSFILAGGYFEKRLVKHQDGTESVIIRNIRPGSLNTIGKDDFHQIILKEKTPAWTLFYHGPRVKHWGFLNYIFTIGQSISRQGFVPYTDNTKPEEKWEKTALKGASSPRENIDYVLVK